jgi:flagellar basal body rod protein FlgB
MSSNTTGILNSTLHINKRLMDIAMQNIANSDNEVYSAKEVDISSVVSGNSLGGVKIDGTTITISSGIISSGQFLEIDGGSASTTYSTGDLEIDGGGA